MVHQLWLFLILLLVLPAWGQDERFYRQILKGELPQLSQELKETAETQFNVKGASYLIDLNGDGIEEQIQPQKRDGVDFIEIKDSSQRKIFDHKLLAIGGESHIYKIKFTQLNEKTKVLVIFLDEGHTAGRRFESTARIFLLTFENNDFSTMKLAQGPHHFHEKESQREQYWRRDYSVEVRDTNRDGTKEIVVQFNHIQRIMIYKGLGEWERL
jgi:hypothetical protein